jgi:hypothetical protein
MPFPLYVAFLIPHSRTCGVFLGAHHHGDIVRVIPPPPPPLGKRRGGSKKRFEQRGKEQVK